MNDCKIIAIANQKGGVGKTTTASNLGIALSHSGKRVLMADFDPQSNLTMSVGIDDPDSLELPISEAINCVIDGDLIPEGYIIHQEKLDILPSSSNLTATEMNLRNEIGGELALAELLEPLRSSYDYIIIDTSPSLGYLTINALTACDSVIIPVSPEYWAATGLTELLQSISRTRKRLNPRISVSGILLTMCEVQTILFRDVKSMLEDFCGERIKIFDTIIPRATKVGRANYSCQPITEYDANSTAAKAYFGLAREVMNNGGNICEEATA